jgi:hypothetical protein
MRPYNRGSAVSVGMANFVIPDRELLADDVPLAPNNSAFQNPFRPKRGFAPYFSMSFGGSSAQERAYPR